MLCYQLEAPMVLLPSTEHENSPNVNASLADQLGGTAGAQELDASCMKGLCQVEEPGFVVYGKDGGRLRGHGALSLLVYAGAIAVDRSNLECSSADIRHFFLLRCVG